MQDLYARLRIEPDAREEEVIAALTLRPEVAAYSAILLDPERRATYTRVHATLKMVGALRQRLDLDSGRSWFLDHHADFVVRKSTATFARRTAAAVAPPPAAETGSLPPLRQPPPNSPPAPSRSRWRIPLLLIIVGAIGLGLALLLR